MELRGSATANQYPKRRIISLQLLTEPENVRRCVCAAYISVSSYLMKFDELDKNTLSLCRLSVTRRWPYACTDGSYWSADLTKWMDHGDALWLIDSSSASRSRPGGFHGNRQIFIKAWTGWSEPLLLEGSLGIFEMEQSLMDVVKWASCLSN